MFHHITYTFHDTDKKENKIFLKYKETQMGAVAKSNMRKGFLYKKMRQYLTIYEDAVSHIRLCNSSFLNFLICEENSVFLFTVYSAYRLFCLLGESCGGPVLGVQLVRFCQRIFSLRLDHLPADLFAKLLTLPDRRE
jgi:hypothetical protein